MLDRLGQTLHILSERKIECPPRVTGMSSRRSDGGWGFRGQSCMSTFRLFAYIFYCAALLIGIVCFDLPARYSSASMADFAMAPLIP